MAIVTTLVGALLSISSWLNSLVGENWTRYFILVGGLSGVNAIENIAGVYALEGLISQVVSSVFGVQGFIIPVYSGVSSLVILAATAPLIFFLIGMAAHK